MSDYETHGGKIKKVVPLIGNNTVEDICRHIWEESGEQDEFTEDDFFDKFHEKYFEANGSLWEIVEHANHGDEDSFCRIHYNDDRTYSFHTRFYNGGTCMKEMLEETIKAKSL